MDQQKMMGFKNPGDAKIAVPVRDWQGLRLALWRSRVAWDIAERTAQEILSTCTHAEGCPAIEDETAPCLGGTVFHQTSTGEGEEKVITSARMTVEADGCPDRELRMSALVILNAARQFAPIKARHPADGSYYAPSRERYAELIAELATAEAELEALRGEKATLPAPQKETA